MAAEPLGRCSLLSLSLLLAIFLTTTSGQKEPQPYCSRIFLDSMYCFNIRDFNFIRQHLPADGSSLRTFVLKDSADLVLTTEDFKHPAFKELTELEFELCNLANINSGLFAGLTSLDLVAFDSSDIYELTAGAFADFGDVTDFSLTGNHLDKIAADTFKNMTNLQFLKLENNSITSIPDNLFVGLRDLVYVDFSDNNLTSLNNETFYGLARLGVLDVSNNSISSIAPDTFSALTELYHVYLGGNKLHTLVAEVFQSNHKMSTLGLTGNDLQDLENISLNISSLAVLDMVLCKIHSIPADYFANVNGLMEVNLNNNSLTNLDAGLFKTMPNIFNIYIDNNNFTSINADMFGGLLDPTSENVYAGIAGGAYLTNNPWDCSTSDMQGVKEYCLANEMDFEDIFECNKIHN